MAEPLLFAYKAGSAAARVLPRRAVVPSAELAGVGAALMTPARRAQVERNLRRVHGPGFEGRELRAAVRATFASYARYWIESFRLPGMSPEVLDAGIVVPSWARVQAGLEAGNGVIFALPHLGGWEWGGFWVATVAKVPITVVVEAIEPPELFEWFVGLRRSFGMEIVPLGPSAGSQVVRALKANHIVCLLCDRDIGGGGIAVDFFGERTTLPAGPATLALRTGAALLPTAVYFTATGHEGVVEASLDPSRTGSLRGDVTRVTQDLAHALERLIRRAPEQWHLMQPNWPSDLAAAR